MNKKNIRDMAKELLDPTFSKEEQEIFIKFVESFGVEFPLPDEPIHGDLSERFKKAVSERNDSLAAITAMEYFLSSFPKEKLDNMNNILGFLEEQIEKGQPFKIKTPEGESIYNFNDDSFDECLVITVEKKRIDTLSNYEALPSSPANFLLVDFLNSNGKKRAIKTTSGGRKLIDRHKTIDYFSGGNDITVNQTGRNNDTISITIENADKITGKGVKKCYAFLLAQCNNQNFKPVIGFPLQELVDRGMYKSLDTARRGLKSALDELQRIKFSGTITKGKKTVVQQEAGILFYHYRIKNNYVEVSVNENFNIEFVAAYFAIIPMFIYSLNGSNAFDIAYYIFTLARQNTLQIKEKGSFNISFKAIHSLLALPTEADISPDKKFKPKQYIIDPILKAIEEIKTAAEKAGNSDFTIDTVYDRNYKNYKDFLEGYVEISFKGDFFEQLCQLADRQEVRITAAKMNRKKRLLKSTKEKSDRH